MKCEKINQAIIDKVKSVLDNAEHIQTVHIYIDGQEGNAPLIRYDITELIGVKENE